MLPSAITDYRMELERLLPQANLSAHALPNSEWSLDLDGRDRRAHVQWSPITGFRIGDAVIRNVDAAVKATSALFDRRWA